MTPALDGAGQPIRPHQRPAPAAPPDVDLDIPQPPEEPTMAQNASTAPLAQAIAALGQKWKAWAQAQIDAAKLQAARDQQTAIAEAVKAALAEADGDHGDDVTALQAAIDAAAPPADPSAQA